MEMKNKPKKIVKMIDPPHGWVYGFPKELPDGIKDVNAWLVQNGYPKKLIDNFKGFFPVRYFEIEKE